MNGQRSRLVGLIVIPLLVLAGLAAVGNMQPVLEPDSGGYLEFDWSSAAKVFGGVRTIGYPAFLRFAGYFGPNNIAVPFLQWLAATLAAWLMYAGLVRAGYRSGLAFWCAVTLMLNREMLDYGNLIMADSLATSLAVASAGCFIAATPQKSNWLAWLGLALFTFLTYQVRPAYLFLIPLWPLMTIFFDTFLLRRSASLGNRVGRLGVAVVVTVLPFVAFCSLRWSIVGHWGLVSFGGYNVVGIAGQFLDRDLAQQLPETIRPLALRIVDDRNMYPDLPGPNDYDAMARTYDVMIWKIAVPAAEELYAGDVIAMNQNLTELSRQILRRRLGAYLRWLIWSAKHAFSEMLEWTFRDRGLLLVLLIAGLSHAWAFLKGPTGSYPDCVADWQSVRVESHLLFWTAIGFASAKSLLVMLVEPSIGRYVTAAMALIPPALTVFVWQYLHPTLIDMLPSDLELQTTPKA